jgi:pyruvyltransferase
MPVEIVHFNPRRRARGWRGYLRPKRPLNNFGDLIGPELVARILADKHLKQPERPARLLTVGSIMRLSRPGDVVWGAGINGKTMATGAAPDLDVRAVRGPHTRKVLTSLGTDVPEVYGDPALLWPRYWPRASYLEAGSSRPVTVVPNHNDFAQYAGTRGVISPIGQPHEVIAEIARSEFVCGSSLHGVILAEAFGIPARLIRSDAEPPFKYDDYYAGTGRDTYAVASNLEEALRMGGERAPTFDADALLAAFPAELFMPQR